MAAQDEHDVEHTFSLPEDKLYWRESERHKFAQPPHDVPGEVDVYLGYYQGTEWTALVSGGSEDIRRLGTGDTVAVMTRTVVLCGPVVLYLTADRYYEFTGRTGWVWPPPYFNLLDPLSIGQPGVVGWPSGRSFDDRTFVAFANNERKPGDPPPSDVVAPLLVWPLGTPLKIETSDRVWRLRVVAAHHNAPAVELVFADADHPKRFVHVRVAEKDMSREHVAEVVRHRLADKSPSS